MDGITLIITTYLKNIFEETLSFVNGLNYPLKQKHTIGKMGRKSWALS